MKYRIIMTKDGKRQELFAFGQQHADERVAEMEQKGYVLVSCEPVINDDSNKYGFV